MKKLLMVVSAIALIVGSVLVAPTMAAAARTVMFTTNDSGLANGPNRVSYILVYVDDVYKCYTESHGNGTSNPILQPGIHKVEYRWATCNSNSCSKYQILTTYINVTDGVDIMIVRIPTVKVKFVHKYGTGVCLNNILKGWALGGGTLTTNVMAGSYTISYGGYYPNMPAFPGLQAPFPNDPGLMRGFFQVCFGASDTYPGDPANPQVTVILPN